MFGTDIVFIHAPTVYDFRKKPMFYGPVSDVVPSSPVFEMYPIGFMTMSSHLEAAGFRTRIVNLAVQMLDNRNLDVERLIEKLEAKVYAIDLHWMPHCHGAIEIAKIVKRYHPDAIVEFGGFSSSYFYKDLIARPYIDMVMRGDSTELPHVKLMQVLQDGGDLSEVPNLVWKDRDGRVRENPLTNVPDDLDWCMFDYGTMIKCTLRNMDIKGALPWQGWDKLPLTSVFTVRGCSYNCAECGGSHDANKRLLCRSRPAFRSPEKLVEDMTIIQSYLDTPIFVIGDPRQGGPDYVDRLAAAARREGVKNHVAFEIFQPGNADFFSKLQHGFGEYSMEISPDSHDEIVRFAMGPGSKLEIDPAPEGVSRNLYFVSGKDATVMGVPVEAENRVKVLENREVSVENGEEPSVIWLLEGRPIAQKMASFGPVYLPTLKEVRAGLDEIRMNEYHEWKWGVIDRAQPLGTGRFIRYPDGTEIRPPER